MVLETVSMVAEAPVRGAVHGSEHCFSVTTPKRTFYLLAESAAEKAERKQQQARKRPRTPSAARQNSAGRKAAPKTHLFSRHNLRRLTIPTERWVLLAP